MVVLRSGSVALVLLLFAVPLAACRPEPADRPGQEVRAVIANDPGTLTLIGKNDRYSHILASQITDSLVQLDAGLRYVPRLAESWDVTEDGQIVTFRLRDGVRWHDGEPFTAADVVFTVARILDPATEARSLAPQFEGVEVRALDDRTLQAVYDRPYADYLDAWTIPIIPEHLASRDDDFLTGEFSRHPVGCGPFRFARFEPGREVVLQANDDYWDGRPALDRLVLRIIPDERTAFEALLSGDIELQAVTPDIWREAAQSGRAEHLERFVYTRLMVWYVGWNLTGPYFEDAATRQAMAMALDRETFIREVVDGLALPGATTYHPDSPWTDPSVRPWPFDPDSAGRLLRQAGWQDVDGDGILERGGTPFRFSMLLPRGSQEMADRIAAWMQQSLAEIGVRMDIEVLEFRAFLERRNSGAFDAVMASWMLGVVPDQFELYHSASREHGLNFFGLSDPEVDRLLERGRVEFDDRARLEIYHDLQRRLHDLEPVMAMFHFRSPVLHVAGLSGVEPSAAGLWRAFPGPRAWIVTPAAGED